MRIGITEAGDASRDFSWEAKLPSCDGAILITKNVTPEFIERVMPFKSKIIVHATITGWGRSKLEPNVPFYNEAIASVVSLVRSGFPRDHVIVRVDPIIPTEEGMRRARNVISNAMFCGFTKFRVSLIDMYPHIRDRFKKAGVDDPYLGHFGPHPLQYKAVDAMLWAFKPRCTFYSCAEAGLKETEPLGCVSTLDLSIFGLTPESTEKKNNRKGCLCLSCKSEMLTGRHPCPNGCLYCYWKTEAEGGC